MPEIAELKNYVDRLHLFGIGADAFPEVDSMIRSCNQLIALADMEILSNGYASEQLRIFLAQDLADLHTTAKKALSVLHRHMDLPRHQ